MLKRLANLPFQKILGSIQSNIDNPNSEDILIYWVRKIVNLDSVNDLVRNKGLNTLKSGVCFQQISNLKSQLKIFRISLLDSSRLSIERHVIVKHVNFIDNMLEI